MRRELMKQAKTMTFALLALCLSSTALAKPNANASLEDLGFDDNVRTFATQSNISLPFTTRADEVMTNANLELDLQSERAAWKDVSHLSLHVNGEEVATVDRESALRQPKRTIAIASHLLSESNNLRVELHKTEGDPCNESVSAGTWKLIKDGSLAMSGAPLPLADDLSMLPIPFTDPGYDREPVVKFAFADEPDESMLRTAALVASYFGRVAGSAVSFPVTYGEIPADSAVVFAIGKPAGLPVPNPIGPMLTMIDHPYHPDTNQKLLLVQGRTQDELSLAARALLDDNLNLQGPQFVVEDALTPYVRRAAYDSPRWLPIDQDVTFEEILGDNELRLTGATGGTLEVNFRVPPDVFAWPSENVDLVLDYQRIAPDRPHVPDIVVELNGEYIDTIKPTAPDNVTDIRTTRVLLPRADLRGFNRLAFHVQWTNEDITCSGAEATYVETNILPTSRLMLSKTRHFSGHHDLRTFVDDGWPFTRMADLSETTLYMPARPKTDEVSSMLSVMAHFAAITGVAGQGVQLRDLGSLFVDRDLRTDRLVIGNASRPEVRRALGLSSEMGVMGETLTVRTPEWRKQLDEGLQGRIPGKEAERARGVLMNHKEVAAAVAATLPNAPDRSAVIITATGNMPMPHISDLQGYAIAQHPDGDLLIASQDDRWRFSVGTLAPRGEIHWFDQYRWLIAQYWVLIMPIMLALILISVRPINAYLSDKATERLQLADGGV
jgi:cellulose synthase (UDP-forming)